MEMLATPNKKSRSAPANSDSFLCPPPPRNLWMSNGGAQFDTLNALLSP